MYYSIGSYINQPLAAEVARVPLDATTLEIQLNDLSSGIRVGEDFSVAFKNIPPKVCFVSLKYNKLCFKNQSYVCALLTSLPSTVTGINLEQNYLGAEKLQAIIKSLKPNVTTLLIGQNGLSEYTTSEIISIVKLLPPHIKRFSFLDKDLLKRPLQELIALCNAIPKTIESIPELETDYLTLWKAHRHNSTHELRAHMPSCILWEEIPDLSPHIGLLLARIASNSTSFNFNHHAFKDKSLDEMLSILIALSPKVTTLSISYDYFIDSHPRNGVPPIDSLGNGECWGKIYSNSDNDKFMRTIPKTISTFRLGITIQYLDKLRVITSLPPHISHLDMSHLDTNSFSLYQCLHIHQNASSVLKYIPPTITSLSLADTDPLMHSLYKYCQNIGSEYTLSDIENKYSEELTRILSELPTTVTFLDMSDNHLETKTDEELLKLFSTVNPDTTIKLSADKIFTINNLKKTINQTRGATNNSDLTSLGSVDISATDVKLETTNSQKTMGCFGTLFNRSRQRITPVVSHELEISSESLKK